MSSNITKNEIISRLSVSANFIGIDVEALTYDEMFRRIDRWIENKKGRSHHIACINTYCVMLAVHDNRLSGIYNGADIRGPDGMPFVKWIRHCLKVNCDRLAAPDIVLELGKRSK